MTNNQKYLRGRRVHSFNKGTEAPKGPERVELFNAKGKPHILVVGNIRSNE